MTVEEQVHRITDEDGEVAEIWTDHGPVFGQWVGELPNGDRVTMPTRGELLGQLKDLGSTHVLYTVELCKERVDRIDKIIGGLQTN